MCSLSLVIIRQTPTVDRRRISRIHDPVVSKDLRLSDYQLPKDTLGDTFVDRQLLIIKDRTLSACHQLSDL